MEHKLESPSFRGIIFHLPLLSSMAADKYPKLSVTSGAAPMTCIIRFFLFYRLFSSQIHDPGRWE